jgi:DNA-directed RNA polymerase specialized sigma subunit
MIAWKYLNKPSATVAAMQDYSTMREIINITPQETKELYDRMVSVGSRRATGVPAGWNPQAGEDRLVKSLDTLDVIQERYRQAVEYMGWFEPAWATLTDTEQMVLREFYMNGSRKSGATARLQEELNFSERQVERIRSRALSRLTHLLFGK